MRRGDELLVHLGYCLGALTDSAVFAWLAQIMASDEEGRDRVWAYVQALRNELTRLLQESGRERKG